MRAQDVGLGLVFPVVLVVVLALTVWIIVDEYRELTRRK